MGFVYNPLNAGTCLWQTGILLPAGTEFFPLKPLPPFLFFFFFSNKTHLLFT